MRNTQEAVPEPIHVSYNQYIHCPCVQLHVSAKWLSFADYSPPHGLISVPMCPSASLRQLLLCLGTAGRKALCGSAYHDQYHIAVQPHEMHNSCRDIFFCSLPFQGRCGAPLVRPTQRFQDGVIASTHTPDDLGHLLYCFHMSPYTV